MRPLNRGGSPRPHGLRGRSDGRARCLYDYGGRGGVTSLSDVIACGRTGQDGSLNLDTSDLSCRRPSVIFQHRHNQARKSRETGGQVPQNLEWGRQCKLPPSPPDFVMFKISSAKLLILCSEFTQTRHSKRNSFSGKRAAPSQDSSPVDPTSRALSTKAS